MLMERISVYFALVVAMLTSMTATADGSQLENQLCDAAARETLQKFAGVSTKGQASMPQTKWGPHPF